MVVDEAVDVAVEGHVFLVVLVGLHLLGAAVLGNRRSRRRVVAVVDVVVVVCVVDRRRAIVVAVGVGVEEAADFDDDHALIGLEAMLELVVAVVALRHLLLSLKAARGGRRRDELACALDAVDAQRRVALEDAHANHVVAFVVDARHQLVAKRVAVLGTVSVAQSRSNPTVNLFV